jgi:uncharacterized protein GlcG (DUF336 family)
MQLKYSLVSALSLLVMPTANLLAAPPAPIAQQSVSLAMANALVEASMSACHAEGRQAVVVVLDRSGSLLALQRDDNVGSHNIDAAKKKAFTALSTKTPSRQLAEYARNHPEAANLNTIDSLLLIGGGVPIKFGTEIIGAIGVGGAGGAAFDEECATKAIAKVFPETQ